VVTLVEHDKRTASLISVNVATLGFSGVVVVISTVARALAYPPRAPYDVVFLDPPYALFGDDVTAALTALVRNGWVVHEAVVIVERSSRDPSLGWPDGFVGERSKRYGDTTLWYGHAANQTQND
jgi:16S rRNA (guanine966-N2)-methyltransferase